MDTIYPLRTSLNIEPNPLPFFLLLPEYTQTYTPPLWRDTIRYDNDISCRPDILSHSLDPIPQLVHTGIPVLQPQSHTVDLFHI